MKNEFGDIDGKESFLKAVTGSLSAYDVPISLFLSLPPSIPLSFLPFISQH